MLPVVRIDEADQRAQLNPFAGVIGAWAELAPTGHHLADGFGATRLAGDALRRAEAGQLQAYTSLFFIGVVLAVGAIFVLSGDVLER